MQEIVEYILRQRANGWRDGEIREHMELRKGYTPGMLNNYFRLADKEEKKKVVKVIAPAMAILLLVIGGLYFGVSGNITGAVPWGTDPFYCGDDVPMDEIMDMSTCIPDREPTKNNLFCYYPESVDAIGLSIVVPWDAEGDNVECLTWDHGITSTANWHECVDEDRDDEPDNLVFYYNDVTRDDIVGVGGLGTEQVYSASYYLCYDELDCVDSVSSCSDGSYCVGKLDDSTGGAWIPCDSSEGSLYRCCTGACEGTEMMCGGQITNQDETELVEFAECVEDGTTACCASDTACVYGGECYDSLQVTEINDMKMVCSAENRWCPEGFEYDTVYGVCKVLEEACYDSSDEEYCNSILGVDDMNTWEDDSGCLREDPDGLAYYEACVWQEISGLDYHFYQDITSY
jgi:hypothetical protein